jgi:hypothetical protein
MILQLNPPIPMTTPIGKGMAQLVIDYVCVVVYFDMR